MMFVHLYVAGDTISQIFGQRVPQETLLVQTWPNLCCFNVRNP